MELADLLESMPPEMVDQLLGLSVMGEKGGLLQEQLAQAQAMGQPSGRQFSTGMGAGLGGLGDLLRQLGGGLREKDLRGQQSALLSEKLAGRKALAGLIGAPGLDPSTVPDVSEPEMIPMGGMLAGSGASPGRPGNPGGPDKPRPVPSLSAALRRKLLMNSGLPESDAGDSIY